jgi:hypothetical protein
MIPKIIHYCWFGGNPYPPKIKACIASWKKYLPEYELKLWDEETFPINDSCQFVKDAYANKKWAFVSDYVRIYALATYGGIYLDTDIEIVKPFDDRILNSNGVILGTDDGGYLTALMISTINHQYFNKMLDIYHNLSFYNDDGSLNMEVNNTYLQDVLQQYGYVIKNEYQQLNSDIEVYPDDYFHARSLTSGKLHITPNTYAIHWHTVTWGSLKTRFIRFVRMKIMVPMLGSEMYSKLTKKIKKDASYI